MKTIDFLTSTGSVALPTVALSYDRLGRFCKAAQGSLVDSNAYDSYGRITNTRQTVNGATYSLSYAYNEYSRIVGITLPDGTNLRKKFTPRGLADSIWFNPRLLASYSYKFGLETSRNLSNGIALAEGYDAAGRLASMVYTLTGQTLPNLGFGYDASGNRKLIRRNHYTTTSEAIGYTTDNQVSTWGQGTADANGAIATPTASQAWTLDSRGNWSGWTQNGTAQARTHTVANELTAMGSTALTWDAAGNLTSDGTLAYVWGARGLLDTAKQGTTVKGIYTYDPLGRRAMKTVGALKTISVYDGWQCVYQKVTGSGTDTTKIFAYGNYIDEPVAMIRKWGTSTDTVWYLQGNNYNVEALTDRTGTVVERYEYSPYGKATVYTGKGTDAKWFTADDVTGAVSAKGNALTFQGRELDAETGALYFRNRYYQPTMGRFVSRDPIRFLGTDGNVFRMENGDPINYTDHYGLKAKKYPCNCLGYAVTGLTDYFGEPARGQSIYDYVAAFGWKCRKVNSISDCKCECKESKMVVVVHTNDNEKNKGKDPFYDPTFQWGRDRMSWGTSYSDFHALRAEKGCSNSYTNIGSRKDDASDCIQTPADPKKYASMLTMCCCKENGGEP